MPEFMVDTAMCPFFSGMCPVVRLPVVENDGDFDGAAPQDAKNGPKKNGTKMYQVKLPDKVNLLSGRIGERKAGKEVRSSGPSRHEC